MNPTNLIISIIVILILGLILKEDTLSQSVKIILCAIVSLVAYCALNIYSIEGFAGKKNKQSGEKTKNKQSGKKSKNNLQQVQKQLDAQSSSTRLTQVETRLTQIETQSNNILPKGTIIMWKPPTGITTTPTPPTGWAYCDGSIIGTGTNSIITPDLRARFVLGANVKNTTNTNTLMTTDPNRVSTLPDSTTVAGQDKLTMTKTDVATSLHLHCQNSLSTCYFTGVPVPAPVLRAGPAIQNHVASIFSSQPPASTTQPPDSINISIVPPYYALAYIMKIS